MICPNCGKENKEHSTFCTGCGEKLYSQEYSTQEIKEDVEKYSNKKNSKALIIVLIICSALIITTIIGVATYFILTRNLGNATPPPPPATEEPTEVPPEKTTDIDMSEIQNIIENYNAMADTAVAIVDFNHDKPNRTYTVNAEDYFIASGFYAPLYNLSYDYYTDSTAEYMMEKMDNASANNLIDSFGGLDSVNTKLANCGASHTTFERYFGDTAASKAGYENYTTAADVATVMKELHDNGGYIKMNVSMNKENISMPSGVSYYAHRGGGIGGAYNIYIFIENNDVDYFVSVLTKDIGESNAKHMISDLVGEIQYQMENIYE